MSEIIHQRNPGIFGEAVRFAEGVMSDRPLCHKELRLAYMQFFAAHKFLLKKGSTKFWNRTATALVWVPG